MTYRLLTLTLLSLLVACSSPEEKAADYVENGTELLQEGKLNKAEIEFKNALQINQNLAEAWFGLAQIHENRQQWRKVYATLSKIREMDPKHVKARIKLGQLFLASNQLDQALKDAKEILELVPDNASAQALMAAVQFRLENFDSSLASVARALAIDPDHNEALLVKARVSMKKEDYATAMGILDAGIKSNPDNVSYYLMKMQAFQEQDDKDGVVGIYQQLIDRFPKNKAFKVSLMRDYLLRKEIDKAEKVQEQIVQSSPDDVTAKLQSIAFKARYRSVDDAIALTEKYVATNAGEIQLKFALGALYEANKQGDKAIAIYQGIADDEVLSADGLEARNKLALNQLRNNQRDPALKLVSEVLEHDKNNENALLLMASIDIADKKYDDAIVNLRTVLRDNPDSIKAYGLLGKAYDADGSTQLAQDTYFQGFRLQPGQPVIANQLGRLLIRMRKFDQADEALIESASKGNVSVETLKLLVQTKLALREWDKAEQLANKLKSMEGQEALSHQVLGLVLQGKQNFDASIGAFKDAHELAPNASQPVVALVRTYVQSGKTEEARRFLDSIIADNDKAFTANLLLGQLDLFENKSPAAKANFEKAIAANPKNELGYRSLAAQLARENNFPAAEEVINRGLSATGNASGLQMYLASVYERQSNFDKAIEVYEEVLKNNPGALIAKNNLASILTDQKTDQQSYDRARELASEFKDSQIPQFRDTFAWASIKSGLNLEQAIVILEGVVKEIQQGGGVFYYHLGEGYRKKGDKQNAMENLNKAVELEEPGSNVVNLAKESLARLK